MDPELYSMALEKLSLTNTPASAQKGALLIGESLGRAIVPERDESLAMALHKPKTAALCFDRIWGIDNSIPPEIRFGGMRPGEYEVAIGAIVNCWDRMARRRLLGVQDDSSITDHRQLVINILHDEKLASPEWLLDTGAKPRKETARIENGHDSNAIISGGGWIADLEQLITTSILASTSNTLNREITPIYQSVVSREQSHVGGSYEALLGAIDALQIVDEQKLTWERVREFRLDREAKKKYRRLILWLDSAVPGRSQRQITEEIAVRLEDYNWTLKKHGISTLLGHIEGVLDPKFLLPAAGVGGVMALFGEPWWAAISSGIAVLGRVAVKVGSYLLERKNISHTVNPEISYVYEMKRSLG